MRRKLILLAVISLAMIAWFLLDPQQYAHNNFLAQTYQRHPLITISLFFMATIFVTAFPFPLAVFMTLTAGYMFGFWVGTLLISFASTIGATLACLIARTLLRDQVKQRFPSQVERFDKGIEKDGAFYLFSLRLIPLVPFFMINLVMGLTKMPLTTFYWVSQTGMLAGTAVYINAGTQLGKVESLSLEGVLTPQLLGAFALLAVFPWFIRLVARIIQTRKRYKKWNKPQGFDYNLIVIGGGAAGLVSAYIANAVKAKVCLVEQERMGGDCLNSGCVPSKTLLRSAKIKRLIERAEEFGFKDVKGRVCFSSIMERIHSVIEKIAPHDSKERYLSLGVDCLEGTARLHSPWEVSVNDKIISTRNVIIATGAKPLVPPFPGLEKVNWHNSDTIWSLKEQPANMLVLGGGPVGCELAQAFHKLGTNVTLVDMLPSLLEKEDQDISEQIRKQFETEGIKLYLKHKVTEFDADQHLQWAIVEDDAGSKKNLVFDIVLVAVGRKAVTHGLGLDDLDIPLTESGTICVNEYLQTCYPNIYACGDVAGPYQFTHVAAHQAWYVVVNALFGKIKKFRVDYSVIPWCTFTNPEVARVGINEKEAKEKNIPFEVTRYNLSEFDRAITDNEDKGIVKVLTVPGKDRILGVTITGTHAGEILGEFTLAMKHGLGLNKILGTIHPYPTYPEAAKLAAGEWKKAHIPDKLLKLAGRWHQFMRE